MPYRLFVIGSSSSSEYELWLERNVDKFECERVPWSSGLCHRIHKSNPDLLIVIAASAPQQAGDLMVALEKTPLPTPGLAIMPADASDELTTLASHVFDDFMFDPVNNAELRHRIARIIGDREFTAGGIDERLTHEFMLAGLVGRNEAFLQTISRIPLVARTNGPVLITGETGTGKELCARAIHALGPRRTRAFVPVDCATIPEQLFESELFGHARGAFTDAHSDYRGLVTLADGATLFLDEIDALSLAAQAKLLRLVQERSYRPLGRDRFITVDAKIIAATNSSLEQLVQQGRFRADLFFRLSVLRLNLIPLRKRLDDVALLARHFVKQACAELDIPANTLTRAAIRKLSQYDWPGNVRELCNVIQRAVAFSDGSEILASHIADLGIEGSQTSEAQWISFREARSRAIESFERQYVEQLMRESGGNVSLAARLANKERRAFGRLVKRYAIERHKPLNTPQI